MSTAGPSFPQDIGESADNLICRRHRRGLLSTVIVDKGPHFPRHFRPSFPPQLS